MSWISTYNKDGIASTTQSSNCRETEGRKCEDYGSKANLDITKGDEPVRNLNDVVTRLTVHDVWFGVIRGCKSKGVNGCAEASIEWKAQLRTEKET
jgi:hypothetical protein